MGLNGYIGHGYNPPRFTSFRSGVSVPGQGLLL